MEFEPMDDFEQELRQGMLRRPAPPSLKRKILERRKRQNTQRVHSRLMMWQPKLAFPGATFRSCLRCGI